MSDATTPIQLPADGWLDWLGERVDGDLASVRAILDELKDGTERTAGEVFDRWNDAEIALCNAEALAGVLAEVHPDVSVRSRAEDRAQQCDRVRTARNLDRALYDVLAATAEPDDAIARRLREHTLRDFRRSGVDRDDAVRARLQSISERLTVLGQEFSRAVRDDARSIRVTSEQLAGLPPDYIKAHPPGDDGLITITTDYPDVLPFRTFSSDADARNAITVESLNRGWPQNDATLTELLALRAEQAGLLGYDSWPDYDAEVKMIGSGSAIDEFIDKLAAAANDSARRDFAVLLERAQRDRPELRSLDAADRYFYEELVRREDFDVDAQQVRRYFDFARVRTGLLDITAKLFGVDYVTRSDVAAWHEDVTAYDVVISDDVIGRIYLDLHPREGKFKHAAQFDLAGGVDGRQLPEGALVCNFARGLMSHADVITLFHEFGHLVHHVLAGKQRWRRFSGVATERDFVEAPSQMLEEWAWNADILRSFAVDDGGVPIPRDLVQRMRAATEFGKGYFVRMQLFYTALSYRLHRDCPDDLTAALRADQERYDLFDYIDDTHMYASFGHLVGYTSAYYTYLWSLVIAKDMFSVFDPADLLDQSIARRYRDDVLAPGGSADATDLVSAFLGRAYSFDAFAAWLDRVPGDAT